MHCFSRQTNFLFCPPAQQPTLHVTRTQRRYAALPPSSRNNVSLFDKQLFFLFVCVCVFESLSAHPVSAFLHHAGTYRSSRARQV